mgnify:CR=1 FL=1
MRIAIIGGGIGGLCAAVTLQKQGFSVQVYEASPTFQPVGAGIGIGSNALQALMEIGVGEEIFANGHALHQQVFLDTYGNTLNTIDLTVLKELYGQENITIHRADLHKIFLKALKPDTLHFNKKYISVEQNDNQVTVSFEDGTTVTADMLIAADGIHSSIRQQLLPGSVTRYAGYTCWRGITENNGRVDEYTSSEYWATQGRFGMAPMKNGLIYWFACINTTAKNPQFQKLTAPEIGDIFVTVTGCDAVIVKEHFLKMKDGAICCNAGHFDCEVDVAGLREMAVEVKPARKNIVGYKLENGNRIYIIAEGRLVNLAAGDGHPAEIMDMSFAIQALSARYLVENRDKVSREPGSMVNDVPLEIDQEVARRKLAFWGCEIDVLTPEQRRYLFG